MNFAYTYIDSVVRQDPLLHHHRAPAPAITTRSTTGTPVVQVPENAVFAWSSYNLRQLPARPHRGGGRHLSGRLLRPLHEHRARRRTSC